MVADYTPHQKRYFAEQLTLSRPARELTPRVRIRFNLSALPAEEQTS
jgi:hypothetical protein